MGAYSMGVAAVKRIANTELLKLADMLASVMPRWVIRPQASRLTSTSWDGDARSTTASTIIDMSAVFGTPANIDALWLRVSIRDSGSAAGVAYIRLDDTAPGDDSVTVRCTYQPNDNWVDSYPVVSTNADGDIYYDCAATGSGTLDVDMIVLGYHVR